MAIDCEANGLQPWLQNDNGWDQGHIFFTAGQVWGMPPYYAQQMASANHQPLVVASQVLDGANLDVSSTMSADGRTLCLHVVNLAASPTSARLVLDRFPGVNPVASLSTLAGTPDAANGLIDPTKIQPVMHELANASGDFNQEFPAYSYTVVRLSR